MPTHILAIPLGIIISSLAAANNFLNTNYNVRICAIETEPYLCDERVDIECVRGDTPFYYGLNYSFLGLLTVCTITGIVNTIIVSIYATRQLRRGTRGFGNQSEQIEARIRTLRNRSILYCLSQLNTTLWSATGTFTTTDLSQAGKYYPMTLLSYLFFPSQGTLNAFIFFHLPFKQCRQQYPNDSWLKILFHRLLTNDGPSGSTVRPQQTSNSLETDASGRQFSTTAATTARANASSSSSSSFLWGAPKSATTNNRPQQQQQQQQQQEKQQEQQDSTDPSQQSEPTFTHDASTSVNVAPTESASAGDDHGTDVEIFDQDG